MKIAQEAFQDSLNKTNPLDVQPILNEVEKAVEFAIERGLFCVAVFPSAPHPIVERAALELEKLGYHAVVTGSGRYNERGESIPALNINWKYLPANTRESYQ